MSSNLTSTYTIDLQIQDDNSKDAIRAIEKGLKAVGNTVKKDAVGEELTKNLKESQKAADEMIAKFHEMAKDSDLDFQAISKAYSKNAGKAIAELEKQYAVVKDQLVEVQKRYRENEGNLKAYTERLKEQNVPVEESRNLREKIRLLEEEQRKLGLKQLEDQVRQNRQIRANLKAAEQSARMERATAKLKELQDKRAAANSRKEKKALDEEIKQRQAIVKSMEQAEKVTEKLTTKTGQLGRFLGAMLKHADRFSKVTQFAYNMTGMVGGAARTAKAAVGGLARGFSAGVSAVAQTADQEVERERQANRIKGFDNPEERVDILRQIYIKTGADYGAIVDAIGRVQGILGKSIGKDELVSAAAIEVRYPGMSQAFASTTASPSQAQFQRYANRMAAMQHATGASDEQIQASTQVLANMDLKDFGSASSMDLQTVYLGLQNSGAFDSQEEMDKAFRDFVHKQRNSGQNVFEAAKNYDWAGNVSGDRNQIQARNTLSHMDWTEIGAELKKADEDTSPKTSEAETMAMRMREVEEKKNQLLMKLIPAVLPVVEKISDLLSSPAGKKIVDGIVKLFETVIPILEPIFDVLGAVMGFINDYILDPIRRLIQTIQEWFDDGSVVTAADNVAAGVTLIANPATPQHANGGIALGPSLVGERGPEAIIPLDYSRAQRAENIAYNIQNSFSMSGNETTALALAEAVSSRDFARAMGRAAFKANRLGAF